MTSLRPAYSESSERQRLADDYEDKAAESERLAAASSSHTIRVYHLAMALNWRIDAERVRKG